MATEILMPRQGNSVESCVILEWRKNEGDQVSTGDIVCEVETDKATFEIEAPADGVLVKRFFEEGDDVPVLTVIAAVGTAGEDVSSMAPAGAASAAPAPAAAPVAEATSAAAPAPTAAPVQAAAPDGKVFASPRAKKAAADKGVSLAGLTGSGPGGRIIEKDVLTAQPSVSVSPAAKAGIAAGLTAPARGTGIGGRILSSDLGTAAAAAVSTVDIPAGENREIPLKGVRKVIAERMHASLQTTAQLTMNAVADARELQAYRKQCKAAPETMGMGGVTLNDMVIYAVSRVLPAYSFMNAEMFPDKIVEYGDVHIGFAVDTDKGLMVPVIRNASRLSLKAISAEAKRLGKACVEGNITPDELSGGTFTISNLGAMGVGHFTPVLNAPQVGILGVGGIDLKAVQGAEGVDFVPHIALSLTIDHRAVDGAPGAKFLKAVAAEIANFRLALAD